jgi:hypothetical protein
LNDKTDIGGCAIMTFDLWASKIGNTITDETGFGTFTISKIVGQNNKWVSFIAAYISVQKGSNIGVESIFAQQIII